jgi:hypothetical protein
MPEERKSQNMRKLSFTLSFVATPVLLSFSSLAFAQAEPATAPAVPEPVAAEPAAEAAPAPEPVADEPAAPAPAPASTTASATVSTSTGGGVVQMGDSTSSGAGGPGGVTSMGGSPGGANGGGPVSSAGDEWKFGFHGYLRAPMRIGIGSRARATGDQSKTTLSVPMIPTDQYIDWQYTQSAPRSTAETFFSYGNSWARGVVSMQAFRQSDSSWIDATLQSGITLAWVELTPDLSDIVEDLRMTAKIGSFWSRYGGAGQYDAGAYETFVIGRTHTVGENIRLEYDYNDFVWFFEEGFGTKEPDPSPFHSIKFTLVGHAHAGFNWDQFLNVGFHYMRAWTQEQDHECASNREEKLQNSTTDLLAEFADAPVGGCKNESILVTDVVGAPQYRADSPDGSMDVLGVDVVLNTAAAGRFFIGGSHIIGNHAVTVAPGIEVIHAFGGGFFKSGITHQYFVGRQYWDDAYDSTKKKDGNGSISTLAFQWDLSVASLIELSQQLDLTAFGMLNYVKSDDDPTMNDVTKLKYGADLVWGPFSWFAAAFRFDRVEPRSNIPEQSFTALAPRLIFRSDFATHEEITIGYAHFLYAQSECKDYRAQNDWTNLTKCVQPPNATVATSGFGNRPGTTATKEQRGGPIDVNSQRAMYPDQGWSAPHEQVFYISADIWW